MNMPTQLLSTSIGICNLSATILVLLGPQIQEIPKPFPLIILFSMCMLSMCLVTSVPSATELSLRAKDNAKILPTYLEMA
jgi:hypothetical protein